MSDKRIRVGASEWMFPNDSDAEAVLGIVERALESGGVAQLELLDSGTGNTVTVYLNGRAMRTVVLDLGVQPRPSEISGGAEPVRRVRISGSEWQVPKGDVADLVKQIEQAIATGAVAKLHLMTAANRAVTVLLNGKTAEAVEVDLGGGPRPSEISGG